MLKKLLSFMVAGLLFADAFQLIAFAVDYCDEY